MADYNSDRTGSNIDAVLDKADNLTQAAVGVGGNVGIGTASPTTNYTNTIHVHSATNGASVHLTDSASGSTANDGLEVFQYGADGYVWERGNGTLRFGTNATERARIDSSGNLLVGTTSATTNCKLKVNGTVQFDGENIYTKSYGSLDTTGQVVAGLLASVNGLSAIFEFTGNGGGAGGGFKILFNCYNTSGVWSVEKNEIITSSKVDIEYSSGAFTFKSKSGVAYSTPRVKVECQGSDINSSYFS